ncbi:MarR family transcriptional regulator [Natrialbaceae archaeon AArc-T1-2]|uniref:MarR family transcriptional regulator n=1 Tax=Natrialbaceae archaeon AArc-T1-2 TaxID=3053904 RepID=UPI00255B23F4|nr:MarR family transcriptional regulator [Natrialbaceae archaeon AArc-T1-2]WIV68583.1 MarR family transcriptional regulator [Natrialbaceae archaeon AArc-T1-2]
MMEQQATTRIDPVPEELASPRAKLVYLYLDAAGGATVDDLNQTLAMKKIAILSVLNELASNDLVEKNGDEYVATN